MFINIIINIIINIKISFTISTKNLKDLFLVEKKMEIFQYIYQYIY